MASELIQNNNILDEALHLYLDSNNNESLQDLVEAASGLIYYFIKIYGGKRNRDDLFQVGVEGLLKAVNRYSPDNGASFSTYAGHCIMGEIRHFVRKEAMYYKPGCITGLQFKIDKEIEYSLMRTGLVPSIKELSEKLNIKEESISEVMTAGLVSFDELDISKINNLKLEAFRLPIEDKITLYQALHKLSDIQKHVIYLLFYRDLTQETVATKLGVNQRQVSRLKQKGLDALKEDLDDNN